MKPVDIPNFRDQYSVSEEGVVQNTLTGKVLKTDLNSSGYKRVTMMVNGQRMRMTVHRVVALTYLKNPNNLPCVNHKDGNKLNNHYSNLEWCDQSYNRKHAFKHRLCQRPNSKLNDEIVHQICLAIQNKTRARTVQAVFNIPKHVFDDIRSRRYYKNISAQYTW